MANNASHIIHWSFHPRSPFLFFLKPRVPRRTSTLSSLNLKFQFNPVYIVYQLGNTIKALGYFLPPVFLLMPAGLARVASWRQSPWFYSISLLSLAVASWVTWRTGNMSPIVLWCRWPGQSSLSLYFGDCPSIQACCISSASCMASLPVLSHQSGLLSRVKYKRVSQRPTSAWYLPFLDLAEGLGISSVDHWAGPWSRVTPGRERWEVLMGVDIMCWLSSRVSLPF